MTKISEYPIITIPELDDLLIGTDVNNSDITKNFSIGSIIATIGVINQGPTGPQGNTGPTGPQGPVGPAGLEWQGEWDLDSSYVVNDAVGFAGASYFCILNIDTTSNPFPDEDTTHWALLANQGAVGPTGPAGPIGPQGPAGTALLTYKVYRASLFFGSEGVSTVVYENTLGGDITWDYLTGYVRAISSSLFATGRTFATSTTYYGNGTVYSFNPFIQSESLINYLSVRTNNNTQGIAFSSAAINVEILVYNEL